jgi:hypothetical protein
MSGTVFLFGFTGCFNETLRSRSSGLLRQYPPRGVDAGAFTSMCRLQLPPHDSNRQPIALPCVVPALAGNSLRRYR